MSIYTVPISNNNFEVGTLENWESVTGGLNVYPFYVTTTQLGMTPNSGTYFLTPSVNNGGAYQEVLLPDSLEHSLGNRFLRAGLYVTASLDASKASIIFCCGSINTQISEHDIYYDAVGSIDGWANFEKDIPIPVHADRFLFVVQADVLAGSIPNVGFDDVYADVYVNSYYRHDIGNKQFFVRSLVTYPWRWNGAQSARVNSIRPDPNVALSNPLVSGVGVPTDRYGNFGETTTAGGSDDLAWEFNFYIPNSGHSFYEDYVDTGSAYFIGEWTELIPTGDDRVLMGINFLSGSGTVLGSLYSGSGHLVETRYMRVLSSALPAGTRKVRWYGDPLHVAGTGHQGAWVLIGQYILTSSPIVENTSPASPLTTSSIQWGFLTHNLNTDSSVTVTSVDHSATMPERMDGIWSIGAACSVVDTPDTGPTMGGLNYSFSYIRQHFRHVNTFTYENQGYMHSAYGGRQGSAVELWASFIAEDDLSSDINKASFQIVVHSGASAPSRYYYTDLYSGGFNYSWTRTPSVLPWFLGLFPYRGLVNVNRFLAVTNIRSHEPVGSSAGTPFVKIFETDGKRPHLLIGHAEAQEYWTVAEFNTDGQPSVCYGAYDGRSFSVNTNGNNGNGAYSVFMRDRTTPYTWIMGHSDRYSMHYITTFSTYPDNTFYEKAIVPTSVGVMTFVISYGGTTTANDSAHTTTLVGFEFESEWANWRVSKFQVVGSINNVQSIQTNSLKPEFIYFFGNGMASLRSDQFHCFDSQSLTQRFNSWEGKVFYRGMATCSGDQFATLISETFSSGLHRPYSEASTQYFLKAKCQWDGEEYWALNSLVMYENGFQFTQALSHADVGSYSGMYVGYVAIGYSRSIGDHLQDVDGESIFLTNNEFGDDVLFLNGSVGSGGGGPSSPPPSSVGPSLAAIWRAFPVTYDRREYPTVTNSIRDFPYE